MTALTHRFVHFKGCATSVWRGGTGRPLLFLHGAQGIAQPLPFMEQLADRFDVIAPEHPGFGRSDSPDWFDDVHDLAYFYLGFLRELGVGKVDVIGQAIGGWIAAEMAVRTTQPFGKLVLVGTPGLKVDDPDALDVFTVDDAELTSYLFYDKALAAGARARALAMAGDPIAKKNHASLTRMAYEPRFYDPSLHKWLDRIDVPTLLLWGEHDRCVSTKVGEAYHALIPGSRLQFIADCAHLPHVEKSAEYLNVITDFLD